MPFHLLTNYLHLTCVIACPMACVAIVAEQYCCSPLTMTYSCVTPRERDDNANYNVGVTFDADDVVAKTYSLPKRLLYGGDGLAS